MSEGWAGPRTKARSVGQDSKCLRIIPLDGTVDVALVAAVAKGPAIASTEEVSESTEEVSEPAATVTEENSRPLVSATRTQKRE